MKYDAIVIGSGQAGNPLSQALAERGWKAVTEKEARTSGRQLKIGTYPMAYVARAIERDETSAS